MQKKVGNALYVFDTTPFTITEDTNVEVIYVQNECLKGYLELNTELESKIKTFNQWLLCVNAPWADGGSAEQPQNYHLLTVPGYNEEVKPLYVYGFDNSQLPGVTTTDWFHVINEHQRIAGMIDANVTDKIYCNTGAKVFINIGIGDFETITGLEIIDTDFGQRYGFIMGDSDMTVDFSYTLKPKYHVNFSADSNASNDIEIDPQEAYAGKNVIIRFKNGQSSSTITLTSTDVELTYDQPNDEYYFTMPAHDVTIKAVHATEQKYRVNFSEDSTANDDTVIAPNPQYAGQTVYIRFLNNQSSSTITLTSADVELTYIESSGWYSFTMPAHDVTIKAVYKPIEISINLGDTDLTYRSDTPYDPSGTYYPPAFFIIQVPEGKTTDNYTFVKSDDKIAVNPVSDHFDMEFKVSGTVTFANA